MKEHLQSFFYKHPLFWVFMQYGFFLIMCFVASFIFWVFRDNLIVCLSTVGGVVAGVIVWTGLLQWISGEGEWL